MTDAVITDHIDENLYLPRVVCLRAPTHEQGEVVWVPDPTKFS